MQHQIAHKAFSVSVGDIPTDVILTEYSDRIMIVITQLNKMGTLISASSDTNAMEYGMGVPPFTIKTLLGDKDDKVYNFCARQLIERVWQRSPKPILLAMSLKKAPAGEDGRGRFSQFKALIQTIDENCMW